MFTSALLLTVVANLAVAAKFGNSAFEVAAGSPFEITWSDATGPVTITLKNGPSTALNDVSTIASGLSGTSFTWTPSASLTDGPYALEIEDSTGPNYSVQFPISGASAASGSSAVASASASQISSGLTSSVLTSVTVSTTQISSAVVSTGSTLTPALSTASASMSTIIGSSGRSSRVSATATSASSQTTRTSSTTGATSSASTSANAAVRRDSNAAMITMIALAVLGAAGNL
ncbi:hypothetical protein PVAG01_08457 [Phlyctema vagabunda]|uniref:Yeast cell wall synthesis Kre9/Knh1-like N-terminal domain-containing protein n=1 Tax=Phlyctema vagabunda TaxID=108571 RepID=A0ABR4P9G9_9HELO